MSTADQECPLDSAGSAMPMSAASSASGVSWREARVTTPAPSYEEVGMVGAFRLVGDLGQGGMGMVYLAREAREVPRNQGEEAGLDKGCPRPAQAPTAAVKLLRPELAAHPRVVQHFLNEAVNMRQLEHPHILPILASGQSEHGPWLAMPYVAGGSLGDLLVARGPLDETMTLGITRQLASALAYAHQRGLIHRDVKPSNILLDAEKGALLADFGLARSLFDDALAEVRSPAVPGTPQYQSPNALRGEHGDTRDDIYSFGAVLYEMLTGRRPYGTAAREELLRQVAAGPPAPVPQVNPAASLALAHVAEGCLARELADRYAHMTYVVEDLDRVARGKAPQGPHGRFLAAERRRRNLRLAVLTGLLALSAAAFWANWRKPASPRGAQPALAGSTVRSGLRLLSTVQLPGIGDWSEARIGRWQSYREPVFAIPRENELLFVSPQGYVAATFARPVGARVTVPLLADLNGDGLHEAFVPSRRESELSIDAINQNGHVMKRFEMHGRALEGTNTPQSLSHAMPLLVADLDRDRKMGLLCAVKTDRPPAPRTLYCFDYDSGKSRWEYELGCSVVEAIAADLDGDGAHEIIIGGAATGNGGVGEGGESDTNSYVWVFGAEGKLRWRRYIGQRYSRARPSVSQADAHGHCGVLVWETAGSGLWEWEGLPPEGRVFRFDATGKVLRERDLGVALASGAVGDLDRDGKDELLLSDWEGRLLVLDATRLELRPPVRVAPRRFDYVITELAGVADLTGDGAPEVVLTISQQEHISGTNPGVPEREPVVSALHNNVVLVLDANLAPLARYLVADKWEQRSTFVARLADCTGDGLPEIVVFTDRVQILQYVKGVEP